MPTKPQKSYKFAQKPLEPLLQQLFRETEDNFPAYDKDGDIVVERDIHCRSLYVDDASIYIGGVKIEKPKFDEDNYYLQYDRTAKKFVYQATTTPTTEDVQDIVGAMVTGNTETFIAVTYEDSDGTLDFVVPVKDEDNMASNSDTFLATQQSIKAYVDTVAVTTQNNSELFAFFMS
jgi:hypothetical protein